MRVVDEFERREFHELAFHFVGRLAGREPGAIGDPEDMGVHRDRRLSERDVEHDVRGLASDAR